MESADDPEVVRRCLAGDERAHRQLVERYQRQVYSVALRMVRQVQDAEDLTQETFVRMFRALDRYDPTRPFPAWLAGCDWLHLTGYSLSHSERMRGDWYASRLWAFQSASCCSG